MYCLIISDLSVRHTVFSGDTTLTYNTTIQLSEDISNYKYIEMNFVAKPSAGVEVPLKIIRSTAFLNAGSQINIMARDTTNTYMHIAVINLASRSLTIPSAYRVTFATGNVYADSSQIHLVNVTVHN